MTMEELDFIAPEDFEITRDRCPTNGLCIPRYTVKIKKGDRVCLTNANGGRFSKLRFQTAGRPNYILLNNKKEAPRIRAALKFLGHNIPLEPLEFVANRQCFIDVANRIILTDGAR